MRPIDLPAKRAILGQQIGCGHRIRAAPEAKRAVSAAARVGGHGASVGHDLFHLGHMAVAMQDQIDPSGDRGRTALPDGALQPVHRDVVGHQQAVKADLIADDPDHPGRGGRRGLVQIGKADMRAHPHGQIVQRPEGGEIGLRQLCVRRGHDRRFMVAISDGATMAGHVLHDRHHARFQQTFGRRTAARGYIVHIAAQAAVLQERVRGVAGNVQSRRTIAVQTHGAQLLPDQAITQAHGFSPALGIVQGRLPFGPMGRAHPLHAAAFLIDGDDGVAPDRVAQIAGQAAQLVGAFDIAGEQDKAPRIDRAEEIPLGRRQFGAQKAKDRSRHCWVAMQSAPSASSAAQKRRASSRDSKPATRRR